MPDQEPLQAFRVISIPIRLGDAVTDVAVAFDVELLERFEDTLHRCEEVGWKWLRLKKSDKTVLNAYEGFCRPYLPKDLDLRTLQPDFCALFFSRVRDELLASMRKSLAATEPTAT